MTSFCSAKCDQMNRKLACEINLLNHNENLPGRCKFQTSNLEENWISLSASNKSIFAVYNDFQMNVICNNQVEIQTIRGRYILIVPRECTKYIWDRDFGIHTITWINISSAIGMHTYKNRYKYHFVQKVRRLNTGRNDTTCTDARRTANFIMRYRSYKRRQNININRPTIVRATSMPSLRQENDHDHVWTWSRFAFIANYYYQLRLWLPIHCSTFNYVQ